MRKNTNTIKEIDAVLWVNIVFMGMAALILAYYIIMANSVTAKNFQIQTLRNKLEQLTEINGNLMVGKMSLENISGLYSFAKLNNLVEAKNISYIFENKNVAQR